MFPAVNNISAAAEQIRVIMKSVESQMATWFFQMPATCSGESDYCNERFEPPQASSIDAVTRPSVIDFAADQSRFLQGLQVTCDGRSGEIEFVSKITANAAIFASERPQDANPCEVSQCFGEHG